MNEQSTGQATPGGIGGCPHCWASAPDAAWTAVRALPVEAELIDESHYHVTIRRCPHCLQCFLSVFTELIDWVDGDDPQHSAVLPVTHAEAAKLAGREAPVTEARIDEIGRGRQSLRHDSPKSGPARTYWATGFAVGLHD